MCEKPKQIPRKHPAGDKDPKKHLKNTPLMAPHQKIAGLIKGLVHHHPFKNALLRPYFGEWHWQLPLELPSHISRRHLRFLALDLALKHTKKKTHEKKSHEPWKNLFKFILTNKVHPWRLTWNIIMDVWKIIFLSKLVICRLHVNLAGCIGKHQS